MSSEKISVCMATYNGSKYLYDQINSILNQLSEEDELVVVDDYSTDSTLDILNSFKDSRIKIAVNESNNGVNKSFEKAILLSKNEFIFMADQDDIWADNRVNMMLNILRKESVNLVSGNSSFIDGKGNQCDYPVIPLMLNKSCNTFENLFSIFMGTGAYFGCAMAFKREILSIILPFPNFIESHDLWIAKASILQRKSYHLEDIVLYRRIHGSNASVIQRSLYKKVWSRLIFIVSLVNLLFRKIRNIK